VGHREIQDSQVRLGRRELLGLLVTLAGLEGRARLVALDSLGSQGRWDSLDLQELPVSQAPLESRVTAVDLGQ